MWEAKQYTGESMSYSTQVPFPGLRRNARFGARTWIVLLILTAAPLVTAVAPASAATYYVDATQGNDSYPGTAQQPWKTMGKVQSMVAPGDTVRIRTGSYGSLALTGTSPCGSSWSAPIKYVADTGQTPTFSRISVTGVTRSWYLVFDGLTVATGLTQDAIAVLLKDASAVKVVNCRITGGYVHYKHAGMPAFGVRLLSDTTDYYQDVTIDGCEITGFTRGIGLGGYAGTGIVFSDNTIYNTGGSGILLNAGGTREGKTVVVSGNHIYDQNPTVIRMNIYGQKSGDFQANEVVTQAQTGASGTVVSQSSEYIQIRPTSAAAFATGSGRTISGQSSGRTLASPTKIEFVEGEHGSGLEIRTRNLIVRNNIIHDSGNTRGIRCYPGHYDGQNGHPSGGYSNMLIENNLVYDTKNSNAVECPESGENFVFRNNTVIGQNRDGRTGPYYYEVALYISTVSGVDGSSMVIANNILVGITGTPPAKATVKGNVMYVIGDHQTGWKTTANYPGNIIVKADDGSAHPNYFEGSGSFFVGGALFDQYSYMFPNNNTHGKNLNDAYKLAAGAGAVGFANAQYVPTTDLNGNSRKAPHDAGCYVINSVTPANRDSVPEPDTTPNDPPSNRSPVLAAVGNKSVSENVRLTFSISATDPDGDSITYSATGLPSGASFSNQTFSWTPTYAQAGTYQVTFIANDGQSQDSETITISVVNVNRAPTLSQVGNRSVDENHALTFSVTASDPDGDAISYSATGLPSGASFGGGSFSWTPSSSQVGSHNVTFVASDGNSQASETVTIFVVGASPDGTAPVVARCSPEPDAIQVSLNNLVTLHVTDQGRGVSPDSVAIRIDGNTIYQGNIDVYQSPHGRCSRSGTPNDYRFIYQTSQAFEFDHTVTVQVNAADRAGNTMNTHAYSFTTEMRAFGSNRTVTRDCGVEGSKSSPATVGDATGNVWVVWCNGTEGSRDIYVSTMAAGTQAFDTPAPITTAASDQCHPDIAQDRDGVLYVVWQDKQRGNWDIFVAMSSDGITWSRPIPVTNSDHNETNPAVTTDSQSPSRVYIAWQDDRDGQADIFAISSTNAFADALSSRLTSDPADQITPDVVVGADNVAYVVWTDMRNGQADIYGSASTMSSWANVPIVKTKSKQTDPVIAYDGDSSMLHLLWVDDAPGNADIYHAAFNALPASPVTGTSIIDDTSRAGQSAPAIACAAGSRVFACWQDLRHARRRTTDTDLFIAELGPGSAGTNIFVGDDGTNSGQREPAIGVDSYNNPYVVWTDARSSRTEIYSTATTFVDPIPLDAKQVVASVGATIGVDPAAIDEPDDVSVIVPPGACQSDARISISRILNPPVAPAECLGSYDFGPSGIDFDVPVTVTIPYRFSGTGGSAKPYWYDSLTGALSQSGITDIENIVINENLSALRFKTTHFTPFYLVASDPEPEDSDEFPGGCSVSATGHGSPKELVVPYSIVALVMAVLRRRDRRRRHSLETTEG